VGVGIAVFVWTGGDTDKLRKEGEAFKKELIKNGRRGREALDNAKKKLETNPPSTKKLKKKAKKKLSDAASKPKIPSSPGAPTAPPMEEINDKDRKKLEELLED